MTKQVLKEKLKKIIAFSKILDEDCKGSCKTSAFKEGYELMKCPRCNNPMAGDLCIVCGEMLAPAIPYTVPEIIKRGTDRDKEKARWRRASKKYRDKK